MATEKSDNRDSVAVRLTKKAPTLKVGKPATSSVWLVVSENGEGEQHPVDPFLSPTLPPGHGGHLIVAEGTPVTAAHVKKVSRHA